MLASAMAQSPREIRRVLIVNGAESAHVNHKDFLDLKAHATYFLGDVLNDSTSSFISLYKRKLTIKVNEEWNWYEWNNKHSKWILVTGSKPYDTRYFYKAVKAAKIKSK